MNAPAQLARRLAEGEAVLFPTDTLPALAARPEAAALLWRLKQRPADKPLILMGADLAQLIEALGVPWQQAWIEQARCHWPGAVTLVLPIAGALTSHLHPGGTSLGLRVPACDRARELLRHSGPLATTSANRSGEPPATTAAEASHQFPGLSLLEPLPWPPGSGQASTVLAWRELEEGTAHPWAVLRSGAAVPSGLGGG
ncbi:L-threonylcarbamoyladenylate synthase [Synechococcus sp. CS-1332]|uniref:L-threonylcarbamoyladenylate synthase n=1 Tax=Synechococcus sp. CS-1332 TaxID=2847972 RepID=UPI00223A6C49|nr:L-threonylcarbamoyladenylate synthase [Synechococcus sp. CS-1332]MCT0206694.1 L-threonylcarbamoyladenylate synthase [Synechococcus sp. CS-1332]